MLPIPNRMQIPELRWSSEQPRTSDDMFLAPGVLDGHVHQLGDAHPNQDVRIGDIQVVVIDSWNTAARPARRGSRGTYDRGETTAAAAGHGGYATTVAGSL